MLLPVEHVEATLSHRGSSARLLVAALAALFLLCITFDTALAKGPIIAVFTIEDKSKSLDGNLVEQLTAYLSARMAEGGRFSVVPRGELRQRLKKQKRQSFQACYDEKCQITIGRELAAQKTLATQIVRLGANCAVISTLYDLKRSATEQSASKKGPCGQESLIGALEQVANAIRATPKSRRGPGSLLIESTPSGAKVWIDGAAVKGVTPITARGIPAGQCFIELRKGKLRSAARASVVEGQIKTYSATLKPSKGKLEITSSPPEADIFLDGVSIGRTPKIIDDIKLGQYTVLLKKAGHMPISRLVQIDEGVRRIVHLKLVGLAMLAVRSDPSGAEIHLDGKLVGRTPAEFSVSQGRHKLTISAKNRQPLERTIEAKAATTTVVDYRLPLNYDVAGRMRRRQAKRRLGWITLGVGLATATAGGVLLFVGGNQVSTGKRDYRDAMAQSQIDSAWSQMRGGRTLSIVGASVVGAGVGVLVYSIYQFQTAPEAAGQTGLKLGLTPSSGGIFATVGGAL